MELTDGVMLLLKMRKKIKQREMDATDPEEKRKQQIKLDQLDTLVSSFVDLKKEEGVVEDINNDDPFITPPKENLGSSGDKTRIMPRAPRKKSTKIPRLDFELAPMFEEEGEEEEEGVLMFESEKRKRDEQKKMDGEPPNKRTKIE
jgi:hypothetical protein